MLSYLEKFLSVAREVALDGRSVTIVEVAARVGCDVASLRAVLRGLEGLRYITPPAGMVSTAFEVGRHIMYEPDGATAGSCVAVRFVLESAQN